MDKDMEKLVARVYSVDDKLGKQLEKVVAKDEDPNPKILTMVSNVIQAVSNVITWLGRQAVAESEVDATIKLRADQNEYIKILRFIKEGSHDQARDTWKHLKAASKKYIFDGSIIGSDKWTECTEAYFEGK